MHLNETECLCLQSQYGNPMIYVTENGVSEKMLCTDLCDDWRMQYFKDYINEMLKGDKWQHKYNKKQWFFSVWTLLCVFHI